MADRTSIEWTRGDDGTPGATWNPVTGCDKVSPGCDHCYAETFAERWRGTPGHPYEQGFDLTLRPERLDVPLRWTRPRRIFVNSMSDLFHKDIPDKYIAHVFAVMAVAQRHTFQLLTKRHGRMKSLLNRPDWRDMVLDRAIEHLDLSADAIDWLERLAWPLPNVWLGVSVEDQHWADIRIPALLDTPAAVRWISAEPLLGPVDLAEYLDPEGCHTLNGESFKAICLSPSCGTTLDWIVVGGESGAGARRMAPDWAQTLRDQCEAADVPFLFKQTGTVLAKEWGLKGKGGNAEEWPEPFPREYPREYSA